MSVFSHFSHFRHILLASRACHTQGSHIINLAASLHMRIHCLAPFNCSSPSHFSLPCPLFVTHFSRHMPVTHEAIYILAYPRIFLLYYSSSRSCFLSFRIIISAQLAFSCFFRLSSHSAHTSIGSFTVAIFGHFKLIFYPIFGSFSLFGRKMITKWNKKWNKNGYCEWSVSQTSGKWSKNAFYMYFGCAGIAWHIQTSLWKTWWNYISKSTITYSLILITQPPSESFPGLTSWLKVDI
jgi:hypothetical protein